MTRNAKRWRKFDVIEICVPNKKNLQFGLLASYKANGVDNYRKLPTTYQITENSVINMV